MKFLLVEDDDSIRQFCIVVLENLFENCEIVEAINAVDAIECFKSNSNFDLIICDQDMDGGNGDILLAFLSTKSIRYNFVLHTSNDLSRVPGAKAFMALSPSHFYLQKPSTANDFEILLMKMVQNNYRRFNDERSDLDRNYKRVRIAYFWRYNKATCDIYLRLNKFKYVKIINANDNYSKDIIDKYLEKNQKYLYIDKVSYEAFTGKVAGLPFMPFLEDNIDWNNPKKIDEMNKTTYAVLQDLILSAGITNSAIELADKYVNGIKNILGNRTHLSEMLFRAREKRDYIFDHSYLVACVSCFIVKDLDWYSIQAVEKLCLAALFHDIILKDPELATLKHRDEPRIKGFTYEETDRFLTHPEETARLIRKSNAFPQDVDLIISQHHENPEGSGFPQGLIPDYTPPLSCLFIIAHDFVDELYRNEFDERKHKDTLTYLYNRYNCGNYRQIVASFGRTMELNQSINLR